jgi:hypothetical protein
MKHVALNPISAYARLAWPHVLVGQINKKNPKFQYITQHHSICTLI